jgi:cell division protein FtsZ
MGRASGDHRVERAILDALDSPLLYGNDIGKAKRILFNIYASDEHPIFVRELQEIDDFFDQLDPNIDVIWGTATDDSLGEDAKVTILATGLEDELRSEVEKDSHRDADDYYEELIPLLYKPAKKKISDVIAQDQELPFEVEAAKETEQAETGHAATDHGDGSQTDHGDGSHDPISQGNGITENRPHDPQQPTVINKWKGWLNDLMKDVTE